MNFSTSVASLTVSTHLHCRIQHSCFLSQYYPEARNPILSLVRKKKKQTVVHKVLSDITDYSHFHVPGWYFLWQIKEGTNNASRQEAPVRPAKLSNKLLKLSKVEVFAYARQIKTFTLKMNGSLLYTPLSSVAPVVLSFMISQYHDFFSKNALGILYKRVVNGTSCSHHSV